MSTKLPVIVSRLESITDWVVTDGKNGLLVKPEIRYDLGEAIKRILGDGFLAGSLGREVGRTILDRFSVKRVADQYHELFRGLIPLA